MNLKAKTENNPFAILSEIQFSEPVKEPKGGYAITSYQLQFDRVSKNKFTGPCLYVGYEIDGQYELVGICSPSFYDDEEKVKSFCKQFNAPKGCLFKKELSERGFYKMAINVFKANIDKEFVNSRIEGLILAKNEATAKKQAIEKSIKEFSGIAHQCNELEYKFEKRKTTNRNVKIRRITYTNVYIYLIQGFYGASCNCGRYECMADNKLEHEHVKVRMMNEEGTLVKTKAGKPKVKLPYFHGDLNPNRYSEIDIIDVVKENYDFQIK